MLFEKDGEEVNFSLGRIVDFSVSCCFEQLLEVEKENSEKGFVEGKEVSQCHQRHFYG